MGQWKWAGLDSGGNRVSGDIDVGSEKEARTKLRNRNIRLRKLTPPSLLEFDLGQWMAEKGLAGSFGPKELMVFTRQLSIMIGASVSILESLEIIQKSATNPALKNSVRQIAIDVKEGKTLSESLESQKGFDKLYCSLVKVGETGGILETVLQKLAEHMENAEKIQAQIKSALIYPAVITCVGIGVVWGMMTFVVPQFVGMLADTGQELPGITKLVIAVSNFFGDYTLLMIPIIFIVFSLLKNYIKTETGKLAYDKFTMNLPLFGQIVVKGNLASFCRTLSVLLTSGIPLIDALDVCINTISNSIIVDDLKRVRKGVEKGKNLTECVVRIQYFPEMVSQMIRVGEQTGQVDSMLEKVSRVFENELDILISTLTKMIEPIVILVLGLMVAAILAAMYLPMFMAAG